MNNGPGRLEKREGSLFDLLILIVLVTIAAGITGVGLYIFNHEKGQKLYALPLLFIGGILLLFVGLTIVALVFKRLPLTNKSHALGLPEGSVRAFIALSLILLFFMMAVYLFLSVSEERRTLLKGVSAADRKAIPEDQISFVVTRGDTFDIYLTPGNEAGVDIAKQLITTVSTLVVAVSAFYFGSNSVQAAHKAGAEQTKKAAESAAATATIGSAAAYVSGSLESGQDGRPVTSGDLIEKAIQSTTVMSEQDPEYMDEGDDYNAQWVTGQTPESGNEV